MFFAFGWGADLGPLTALPLCSSVQGQGAEFSNERRTDLTTKARPKSYTELLWVVKPK